MKHMIRWLKICAFLLSLVLIVHVLEVAYDIWYHVEQDIFFKPHPTGHGK